MDIGLDFRPTCCCQTIPDKNSKDGSYLIGVRNHKTFSYYGKAMVILKQIEYKWLKIYVEKIRSRL